MKRKKYNILITGASRGIGNAITKRMVDYSNRLFLTSKDQDSLESGTNGLEKEVSEVYRFNLDQSNGIEAADALGKWVDSNTNVIDVVVLCAGNYFEGDLCTMNTDEFDNSLNTNFLFNYHAVRKLVPFLKKSNFPRIIIIGSTAAYEPYSVPSYGVAKWALRGLAVNLRKELSKDNIGVTFISPGPVLTDMWADVDVPDGRILEPDDIAKVVSNLMELSQQAVVEELIIRPMLGDYDE